ncbi:unnamed protein product, partial [Oikopleura dioica]
RLLKSTYELLRSQCVHRGRHVRTERTDQFCSFKLGAQLCLPRKWTSSPTNCTKIPKDPELFPRPTKLLNS